MFRISALELGFHRLLCGLTRLRHISGTKRKIEIKQPDELLNACILTCYLLLYGQRKAYL